MNSISKDDFTKVSYKRKGRTKRCKPHISKEYALFDIDANIRRINEAKNNFQTTDFFQSVTALLREGLQQIDNPEIKQIICFGLGRVSELMVPRYQLALLLCLKDFFDVEISATDPIFDNDDLSLLKHYEISLLEGNIEGKFEVGTGAVLFYLPHCPKQLMNNLLWSNWGLNLSNCIIIGNSINKVVEDSSKKVLKKSAKYITNISPYVLELGIVNNFTYFDVFNDTSIHVFPINKLNVLTDEFWNDCREPEYLDSDIEFIKSGLDKL